MPLERIKVAVKSDEIVLRDPKNMQRITTKGTWVQKTPFWIRRLKAGDCVELKPELENKISTSLEDDENGNIV